MIYLVQQWRSLKNFNAVWIMRYPDVEAVKIAWSVWRIALITWN